MTQKPLTDPQLFVHRVRCVVLLASQNDPGCPKIALQTKVRTSNFSPKMGETAFLAEIPMCCIFNGIFAISRAFWASNDIKKGLQFYSY